MESPVSEKMCSERHKNLEEKFDKFERTITGEVAKITKLWTGNGAIGYKDKLERMWEDWTAKRKTSQGYMDWGFRILIIIILGWLGLK